MVEGITVDEEDLVIVGNCNSTQRHLALHQQIVNVLDGAEYLQP